MAAVKPHYFSRSAGDTDDGCRRARGWSTQYGGRGLDTTEAKEALSFGTEIHAGLREIWETDNLSTKWFHGQQTQLASIGRGLLYAYYHTTYKRYIAEGWTLLAAEKECSAHIGFSPKGRPLILLAQPDLLLQHGPTGIIRYVEGKSTKDVSQDYMESWRFAPQLSAGLEAVWQTLGVKVDEFVMQFFYKGVFHKEEGRWTSPFVSAWGKISKFSPDIQAWKSRRPQSYAGWQRFDVADYFSETEWFEFLRKEGELGMQVPENPPIKFDERMAESWLNNKLRREGEIADADYNSDIDREAVFPQTFLRCRPPKGFACPFLSLCWNPSETKNPFQSGNYKWREPHHAIEAKALNEEKTA